MTTSTDDREIVRPSATLQGNAFLIMWHDIAPEADDEYNLWHTRQHMPERIALPGFLRARRGVNRALSRQTYFTLYEGDTLDTFLTKEYSYSLNVPTAWTTQVAPHFRNFLRMTCAAGATFGRGAGGALTTVRVSYAPGATEADALAAMPAVTEALMALPSVCGVHLGIAQPKFSSQATKETELRPRMDERPFDLVVVVEGIGLAELTRDEPAIVRACAALPARDPLTQSYDVAYTLARTPN
jgi:hypothetical protein